MQSYYFSGTQVTLSASPDDGWQFDGWSGDLEGSTNSAQVTMDAAKAITATFTDISHWVYLPLVQRE